MITEHQLATHKAFMAATQLMGNGREVVWVIDLDAKGNPRADGGYFQHLPTGSQTPLYSLSGCRFAEDIAKACSSAAEYLHVPLAGGLAVPDGAAGVHRAEVAPATIMRDHYIAMMRYKNAVGNWFPCGTPSSDSQDPAAVLKNARSYWPECEIRLVVVQLPVVEVPQ